MKTTRTVKINGLVQGVGFRPFIFRIATKCRLTGFIQNSNQGVIVRISGGRQDHDSFIEMLKMSPPERARLDSILIEEVCELEDFSGFEIRESESVGAPDTVIPADVATCSKCLEEIFDSSHPRYQHAFTHCIDCGPRLSIIQDLPYDRIRTTMAPFAMCDDCRTEYHDPQSRRFHAQTNCCHICGPRIYLTDQFGRTLDSGGSVFDAVAELLSQGKIIAVKSVGGFQLWVDSANDEAVQGLRIRKNRPTKPFAVLFDSVEKIAEACVIQTEELTILRGAVAPLVLLRTRLKSEVANSVAPDNPYLGVMLPSSPLQSLLLAAFKHQPVVATSGNISGEPICTSNDEALVRLAKIADYFVIHDREIVRPLDDSIIQWNGGARQVLRVGRGLAPLEIQLQAYASHKQSVVGFGGDLKAAVSIYRNGKIYLGPHLGDLEDDVSFKNYETSLHDLCHLTGLGPTDPAIYACDMHPGYFSTNLALNLATNLAMNLAMNLANRTDNLNVKTVQHHEAHALSAWVDALQPKSCLVLAWDGTGYGVDHSLCGSEILSLNCKMGSNPPQIQRLSHFPEFPLPGGDEASRDPRRSLLGLLWSCGMVDDFSSVLDQVFKPHELKVLCTAINRKVNSPMSSSVGRLFDAIGALLNFGQKPTYEGEIASAVEFAALRAYELGGHSKVTSRMGKVSITEFLQTILIDIKNHSKSNIDQIALKFHLFLVDWALSEILSKSSCKTVLLTGGVFQNRLLTHLLKEEFTLHGFTIHTHERIPPNDGGLSVGQVMMAYSLSCYNNPD